jgi:hypothetical protein
MFQFPGFASLLAERYHAFSMVGCPIRTPADQFLFADPRSFSQLITSFFASESLGIPHTLLFYFSLLALKFPTPLLKTSIAKLLLDKSSQPQSAYTTYVLASFNFNSTLSPVCQ